MRIPRKLVFKYDNFFHIFNKFNPELTLKRKELFTIQEIINKEALLSQEVKIVASNILQNHYHLLLSINETEYNNKYPDEKRLGIYVFMQKINTKIAIYVNNRKKRHGKVFYDRYKSKLIDCIEYFNHAFLYITNNAMKHYGIKKEKWKYSSYHFYNKTKNLIQKFIVHFGIWTKKIFGVSPLNRNHPQTNNNIPFFLEDT